MRELLAWRLNRGTRARLADTLRSVNGRLGELMRSTERDFLEVGGQLDRIRVSVGTEAETLAALSASAGGGEGESLAGALGEAAQWADREAGEGGSGRTIAALLPAARAVRGPLLDLRKTIRALRAMGVLTRVESARLGSRGAGFEALAEELDSLTAEIGSRSDTILEAVDGLCVLLEEAREAVEQLERRQQAELHGLVARSGAGLRELQGEQERVANISRNAVAGYERATAGAREIFVALQFHDSTRQRIEHVQSALEQLSAALASPKGVSAGVALRSVELQAAQLREARQSFLDSLARIRADLDGLGAAILEFSRSARDLSGGPGTDQAGIDGSLALRCGEVGAALRQWIDSRRALAEAAGRARSSCARIASFTSEIETVGMRVLWLALNAEIQAVGLETSGAVMESVAESIRGVSREAAASASAVNLALRRIEDGVARMADELGDGGDEALRRARTVEARVGSLASGLEESGAERRALLESIARGSDALSGEIAALCRGITADESMKAAAEECLAALGGVAERARAAGPRRARGLPPAAIVSSSDSYTMHAEREVHEAFAAPAAGPPAAPAAGPPAAPAAAPPAPPGGSEFGENVEMF